VDVDRLKKAIVSMLEEKGDGLSFVDLSSIEGFCGDMELMIGDKNIVLWSKISQQAITALSELSADKIIDIVGTSVLVYHADGLLLTYPIAKENRRYKQTRWAPSVINKGSGFAST
jgi:hypothetical protein